MALDKNKEFMTVSGSTGVKFQQNNKLYLATGLECDIAGKLIEEDQEALEEAATKEAATKEAATKAAKLQEKQEKLRQVDLEKQRSKTTVGKSKQKVKIAPVEKEVAEVPEKF